MFSFGVTLSLKKCNIHEFFSFCSFTRNDFGICSILEIESIQA